MQESAVVSMLEAGERNVREVVSRVTLDISPLGCVHPGDLGCVIKDEPGVLQVIFPNSFGDSRVAKVPFFLRRDQVRFI